MGESDTTDPTGGRIVVGVDGSEASRVALRWAAEEAQLHQAMVHVVYGWQAPYQGLATSYAVLPYPLPDRSVLATAAAGRLEQTVRDVFGDDTPPGLTQEATEGNPVQVLVRASQGAQLMVLGSRGRGGFAGMLLGSVSEACARHAHCTVVVVRPDR